MPQLRGSRHVSRADEFVEDIHDKGFSRIFGIETEYGVSVTENEKPVEASQVAMMMFQPVVTRSRSTNTYLSNGARLYLDVGSHPEYATAEARTPMQALSQDLAGGAHHGAPGSGCAATVKTTVR
jgi:proteasome accessory factor A